MAQWSPEESTFHKWRKNMCPAKQVWSDPDVTAFSSHSGGFFPFFFFFCALVHPTFYLRLLTLCSLTLSFTGCYLIVYSFFILNHYILTSVYLLFAWAIGLKSGGSEVHSLPPYSFLHRREFWTPQMQPQWLHFQISYPLHVLVMCQRHFVVLASGSSPGNGVLLNNTS